MDELALRYLGLVLRLERHQPGLLAAYAGPGELREAVAGEGTTQPRELHDEALRLRDDAAPLPERRSRWLSAQANALAAVARVAGGEEIALPDLVESLCDLPTEREPESALLAAHRLLDAALPAGASLRTRLAQHRAANAIPAEMVPALAERLASVLRARTAEDLGLPPGETLVFEPTHAVAHAWHGRPLPEPPLRTRIELNLSAPWSLESLVGVVAGEAYPGGHGARVIRASAADASRGETLAWTTPTPEATIGVAISAVGREVLLSDFELASELRHIGHESELSWEPERDAEVRHAHERLAPAISNAGLLLHHDGLPASEVRNYLAEIALMEPDAIEGVLGILAHPLRRVEPFARAYAPRLVRRWLAGVGQTDGLRRLMSDQLTPAALLEGAGVAG